MKDPVLAQSTGVHAGTHTSIHEEMGWRRPDIRDGMEEA